MAAAFTRGGSAPEQVSAANFDKLHSKNAAERGQAVPGNAVVWIAPDGPLHEAEWASMWSAPRTAVDASDEAGASSPAVLGSMS
jgi:hypothetical protein